MPDNPEVLDLRRRARRRLIGAIALVLALVIVPPWIMDLEPRPVTTDLTVRIPAQDAKRPSRADAKAVDSPAPAESAAAAKSEPAVRPDAKRSGAEAAKAMPKADTAGGDPSQSGAAKPEPPKATAKAEPAAPGARKEAEAQRAEALLSGDSFVVPLGSFASRENVKSLEGKLAKAGIKYYTETVTAAGVEQTRVRAGPYASKDAADKAREQLKTLGLAPGNVVPRQ